MEPVNFQMPGYRINEYLLVLSPHEELWKRIQKVKEEFADKYKTSVARYTKPHITLVNFVTWDMMEERILQRLQMIAMGVAPFKVELRDFGSFPSHTIFINVVSKLPVQNLVKEIKEAQRLMKLNKENKPHFIDEPHLTICRKLKPWQYEQGWLEYSNRHFTGRFIADSMLLLKRPAGGKGAFQIAKRFEFQNLPVATKQGNLFPLSP
jgi:2'-5' RNA ligase